MGTFAQYQESKKKPAPVFVQHRKENKELPKVEKEVPKEMEDVNMLAPLPNTELPGK